MKKKTKFKIPKSTEQHGMYHLAVYCLYPVPCTRYMLHTPRFENQYSCVVIVFCSFHPQAKGMAEGTIGTAATVIGGLIGIAVLVYLAQSV